MEDFRVANGERYRREGRKRGTASSVPGRRVKSASAFHSSDPLRLSAARWFSPRVVARGAPRHLGSLLRSLILPRPRVLPLHLLEHRHALLQLLVRHWNCRLPNRTSCRRFSIAREVVPRPSFAERTTPGFVSPPPGSPPTATGRGTGGSTSGSAGGDARSFRVQLRGVVEGVVLKQAKS